MRTFVNRSAFLQTHYVRRIHTFKRVARIYDQSAPGCDLLVVKGRVICDNRRAIRLRRHSFGLRLQDLSIQLKLRHMRVAEGDPRPAPFQEQHNVQGRGFPQVVDIFFVGHTKDMDVRSLDRLPAWFSAFWTCPPQSAASGR